MLVNDLKQIQKCQNESGWDLCYLWVWDQLRTQRECEPSPHAYPSSSRCHVFDMWGQTVLQNVCETFLIKALKKSHLYLKHNIATCDHITNYRQHWLQVFSIQAQWHRRRLWLAEGDPTKMQCRCMCNTKLCCKASTSDKNSFWTLL